ncbi:T9SS type B sorting domain-containing protein [Aquimarina sp. TRL1]|uniref:T9SS type B sorting domain-containing protein n=1 Tax=Aquimarina sp. (strain TRL1) TaxID=2736252 RepID=UPI00158BA299|nr:T9SS type B sorting domain-containing protein [Aquimarina sp. TRL1]QKX05909.1 T9SS type B sorting domain-containing protein [Aquimarina sp. TRL1]
MKIALQKKISLTKRALLILPFLLFHQYSVAQCLTVNNIGTGDADNDNLCDLYDLDDDNDGIPDTIECNFPELLVNGSFELDNLVAPRRWALVNHNRVTGWNSSIGIIEYWGRNFLNVNAPQGDVIIELNSTRPSAIFQTLNVQPGDRIFWSVSHKGRAGTDEASVRIGATLAGAPVQTVMRTGRNNWRQYVGVYTVPPGQNTTLFILESVSTHRNSRSVGNLIDNVQLFSIDMLENCQDTDGDGIANSLDLDSDNDGIYDVVEAGGTDDNDDGRADDNDNNANNTITLGIPSSAGNGTIPIDTGNNGSFDFLNLDSDEDGCSDADIAYNNPLADNDDGFEYGDADTATNNDGSNRINANGLVTAASYDDPVVISHPVLKVLKRVLDKDGNDITGGNVKLGDEIFYELEIENQGNENITNASIKDIIPANVNFVPGSIDADTGLNASYDSPNRQINITIDNTVVERFDSAIKIKFKTNVVESCADLREACSNEIKNIALATYTGSMSGVTINEEESILDQDACLFDIEGASTFLIDMNDCDGNFDLFICSGTADITAGGGFTAYRWTNLDTNAIIGNTQTITVSSSGRYRVDKTGNTDCPDLFEIWTVKAFNEIVNPIIEIAERTTVNGNIRTCAVTGDKLPELFLCGEDDEITLDSGFVDATSITWERLDSAACPSVIRNENCPTIDGQCEPEWTALGTNREFTVTEAGEYRIKSVFDGNCTISFYFNVYKNNFKPNLVAVKNIICDVKGVLRVQNSSNHYEYQLQTPSGATMPTQGDPTLDPDANGFQDSPEFSGLTDKGKYTVKVRQNNGLPTACTFEASKLMDTKDPTVTITTFDPGCPNDTGEMLIKVEDGASNYTYNISSTTNNFTASEGPTTETNHTFKGLNPDTYDIEVLSYDGDCIDTQRKTIKKSDDFIATASLQKDLSCNTNYQPDATQPNFDDDEHTALFIVNITGGKGPFTFSTSDTMTPALTPEPNTTNEFRFTSAGARDIYVKDETTGCIIPAGTVTVTTYEELEITMTGVPAKCPGNKGAMQVEVTAGEGPFIYILDSNIFTQAINTTTHVFNNITPGNHSVIVVDQFGCNSKTVTVNLPETKAIEADFKITQEYKCTAAGIPEQTATISITNPKNGNGNYEYSIDGVDFTNTTGSFTGLKNGVYTVYIRDTNTAICPVELGQLTVAPLQQVIDLKIDFSQVECDDLTADATLTPTATNGANSFEYRITGPTGQERDWQTSNVFNDLPTGASGTTYTFEARTTTDGCIYSEDITLKNIDFIGINAKVTQEPTCQGDEDAIISFNITTIDLTKTTFNYEITGGTITGNQNGNNLTDLTTAINGLGAGTYAITVTDNTTKCTATANNIVITDPQEIKIDNTEIAPLTCINNAIVTITASGGNGGTTYELKDSTNTTTVAGPQTTNVFSIATAATYTVVVKDNKGCTVNETITITPPPTLTATVENTSDLCYDSTNEASMNITVNGGTSPFTFTINGGGATNITGNTFSINNLTPDDYEIIIKDKFGCETTINQTISEQLTTTAALTKDIDCSGTPNASIAVTSSGGTAPITLQVSNDGGTSFTAVPGGSPFSTNVAGDYQFKVIDANGCEAISNTVKVTTAPDPEIASTAITPPTCQGAADGIVELTVDNTIGTPPYEINFNSGGFSENTTFGGLAAGTYTYVIRDARQCITTPPLSVTIADPAPITIGNLIKFDITCTPTTDPNNPTLTNGSVIITGVTGGTGTYDYTLLKLDNSVVATAGNPSLGTTNTNISFSDLSFGDYIFKITDSNGCNSTFNFNIATRAIFTVTESAPTVSCTGGVTVDINVQDGTGPFSIREYPNGTPVDLDPAPVPTSPPFTRTFQFTNLDFDTPFTYEVIDNGTGCTDIRSIAPQPSPSAMDISITPTSSTCNGADNGKIAYEITDYNGNELTYEIYSVVDLNTNIASSFTFSNGNAQTGLGTGPATGEVTGFSPGVYQLRIFETDGGVAAPCNAAMQFTIEEPEVLKLARNSKKDGFCSKLPELSMIASGGTAPYTYIANDGTSDVATSTSGVFNTLTDGTYHIRVEDSNGCTVTPIQETLNTITNPSITPITAYDRCDFGTGYTFTVNATGTGQLSYSIDGISFVDDGATHTFTVTSPGTYTVTARDPNGCTGTQSIEIHEDLIVSADFDTEPTCTTGQNITVNVSGGSDFTSSPANFTFTLTGTDINGTTVNTTQNANNIFASVLAGDYTVTVTDTGVNATGCTKSVKVARVYTNPVLTLADSGNVSCNGGADGFILVELQAGTGLDNPFTYRLFDRATNAQVGTDQIDNPLFENLSAATNDYRVEVTSVFGCTAVLEPIEITEPIILSATPSTSSYSCNANNDKLFPQITVDINGGTAPYKISYTGPLSGTSLSVTGTQFIIDAYESGDYTITVTDKNNCTHTITPVINIPTIPEMTSPDVAQVTAIDCNTNTEEVTISINGGTGPFNFTEINGAVAAQNNIPSGGTITTSNAFQLPGVGNYIFEIHDTATGCSIRTDIYPIEAYDTIEAEITDGNGVACFNSTPPNGSIELTVSGHTGAYTYQLNNLTTGAVVNGAGNTTAQNPITIAGLSPGNIQVTVTDPTLGCTDETSIYTIPSAPTIDVSIELISAGFCNSSENTIIEAFAQGGSGDFEYRLEDQTGTPLAPYDTYSDTPLFENLDPVATGTTYQVRVKDANGCEATQTIIVSPPQEITIASVTSSTLSCVDSRDGSISITAAGGQGSGSYFFTITHPDGTKDAPIIGSTDSHTFTNLPAGEYTIEVTDNLNCEASQNVTIDTLPEVIVAVETTMTPSCADPTASVQVTGVGGTPPYEFSKDGTTFVSGTNPHTFNNLTEGDYSFYVKDINNCISKVSNTVPIRNIEDLSITLDKGNTFIICFGDNAASIDAFVTGGLGDYTYSLTGTDYLNQAVNIGPQNDSFFGDLLAGDYTYSVTSKDCGPEEVSFTIEQPEAFTAEATPQDISCNSKIDGSISVTASGGSPGYIYSLFNSADEALFTFVKDDSDGTLGSHVFDELPADIYRIEVSDENGCSTFVDSIEIKEPLEISAQLLSSTPESCAGDADGSAIISISGGVATSSTPVYYWSTTGEETSFVAVPDPSNLVLQDLPGGITTVFIRDENNNSECQLAYNIDITPGAVLEAELTSTVECPVIDSETGRVITPPSYTINFELSSDATTTDIIYSIQGINGTSTPPANQNLSGTFIVPPGEYEGFMLNSSGCEKSIGTITVETYTPLATPSVQTTNNSSDVNEYEILAEGGTAPYTYYITFIDGSETENELPDNIFFIRKSGEYKIRVVDSIGCETSSTIKLTYINLIIPNYFAPDKNGVQSWYPDQTTTDEDIPFLFENIEVRVFDRYGRLLADYKGDHRDDGWKGIHQGKELPSGDYWYMIIVNDKDNREFTGHFTLYRE